MKTRSHGMNEKRTLMLDIFNSCVITGVFPTDGSPCHKELIKILKASGKEPTAKSKKPTNGSV